MSETKIFENLDANESIFFARELKHIKAKTFDIKYPVYKAKAMLPVDGSAGPGAETITYQQFDRVGIMKIIAAYADDLPRSDIKGVEFSIIVQSLGGSYGYSIQEIRAAQMAGRPLTSRKATAVRQSYEQEINKIGWFADGTQAFGGMFGILFQPNVTVASATNGDWIATATPDEIISDVGIAIDNMRDLTLGVEEPDTINLPVKEFGHISTTPRSTVSDTSILEYLQKAFPAITFDWVNELKAVTPAPSGGAATNVMMVYKKDPDKLTFEIPQGFEQFAPQQRNLEFVVPAHGRVGGVIVYYPLSVSLIEGL